jgi:choline dehydrogenase-like flavoprotein
VLAARLSEDPNNKVLLLEAGKHDWYLPIHIPLGYLLTMTDPRTSWEYKTSEQPGLNGRAINYPRGKVLGGSSSINGMIYMRGQKADFDVWAKAAGGEGADIENGEWSWQDMLQCYNKDLDYGFPTDSTSEGSYSTGGQWRVEKQRLSWEVLDTFREAAAEHGVELEQHFNNSNEQCSGYLHFSRPMFESVVEYKRTALPSPSASNDVYTMYRIKHYLILPHAILLQSIHRYFQVNQNSGVRLSAYRAFLKPVEGRPNLTIRTQGQLKRVVVDEGAEGSGKQQTKVGVLMTCILVEAAPWCSARSCLYCTTV